MPIPALRIQACNQGPICADGDYVLYWMIAARRATWNFGLEHAVDWAKKLGKPLVVFEPLRVGYRWASDRLHQFVLDGMADQRRHFAKKPVLYYPYVEPAADTDKGLLPALADRACVVVTDEFPAFFLPRMVRSAAAQLAIRVEQVDGSGLLPLRGADKVFETAYAFRHFLHRHLPAHLSEFPNKDPLARVTLPVLEKLPLAITRRWPMLVNTTPNLANLPIDHTVRPTALVGGHAAAQTCLREFLRDRLERYAGGASHPDDDARSRLSPYLHFGHLGVHQVFHELAAHESWSLDDLAAKPTGRRDGWWGMSESAEAFLDEQVTWRELSSNFSAKRDDYDQYESLPPWAQGTLEKHRRDPRPVIYTLSEFAAAGTHDDVWNAAQLQLIREGYIHNYLRMLWGKKILEWSKSPREALEVMIELNNKYALDGRDPNSYSGIFWVLGRYDHPWPPERPIFGTVRYMTSDQARRKLRMKKYLEEFASKKLVYKSQSSR